jgi:hypothetical protein
VGKASFAGLTVSFGARRLPLCWSINPPDVRARRKKVELPLELVEAFFDQLPVTQLVLHARRVPIRVPLARRMST